MTPVVKQEGKTAVKVHLYTLWWEKEKEGWTNLIIHNPQQKL